MNSKATMKVAGAGAWLIAMLSFSAAAPAQNEVMFSNLPRLGEIQRPVIVAVNQLPEDMAPDSSIFGLSMAQDSWPAARMTTASGKTYFIIIAYNQSGTSWFSMTTNNGNHEGVGMMQPEPRAPKLPAGQEPIKLSYDPAKGLLFKGGHSEADSLDITVTSAGMEWKQGGVIDLHGKIVTPATVLYVPWREGRMTSMQAWATQEMTATGTIFGEPVTGFMHIDRNYDRVSYGQTPMARRYNLNYSSLFITQYADGTTESGVFMCAPNGARAAFAANNKGEVVLDTNRMNMQAQFTSASVFVRADYTLADGQKWQYIAAPNTQNNPIPSPDGQVHFVSADDGVTTRVGEKRKVVAAWSVMEGDPHFACAPR